MVDSPNDAERAEVVHVETSAALMKEVAVREWRGGSSGVSFRIAPGVRYHVRLVARSPGHGRHAASDGGQWHPRDHELAGCAYLGTRKTVDMPYSKPLGMHLYPDAISFSLSNQPAGATLPEEDASVLTGGSEHAKLCV